MALFHPHRFHDLGQALLALVARQPGQLEQGPTDQVANGVAAVQCRVGVLENDLHRLELVAAAARGGGAERAALELDLPALVRWRQTEQHPGERGLPASRFPDQSERLTEMDIEIDTDKGLDFLPVHRERLRHAPQPDDGLGGLVRGRQLRVLRCRSRERRCPVVEVAARDTPSAHLVQRRLLLGAAPLGERATLGEDAARHG